MTSPESGPTPEPDVFFGQPVIAVAIITIILSTLLAGARCWSRAVILGIFGLEDWMLLLGWACAIAVSAGNIAETKTGIGHMFGAISPEAQVAYLKTSISINIIYAVALLSVKISILCLYLRALQYDYVQIATKVMLGIVAISHAWIILSLFTVCIPLDAFWDLSKKATAYCHPFSVYWSHTGINIVTDFLIFALPLTVVRKLRVPPKQKKALYCVFTLAFCVCIISLVRALFFINGIQLADRRTIILACWTIIEVNMAVMCACLITLKPLVSKFFPRLLATLSEEDVDDHGIETIGRARQKRRDPMDSDLTPTVGGSSATATESAEMADLEAQKSRESSGVESDIAPPENHMTASNTTLVERAR